MSDEQHMKRAIALARRGEGRVEPNPMVGCVIVKRSRTVGEGWHKRFGGPHAEVHALRDAGRAARGATAYVTLEPCRHHGKTPPCTDALIDAGVGRVVVGCRDPHTTSGGGVRRLRRAGIAVEVGPLGEACAELIAPFTKVVTQGLPFVTLKWAQTIDGSIATASGDSQWISNEQSRKLVHRRRGRVDAVMVGIGTVLADDPQLTARDAPARRIARRVVVDPRLRLGERSKLVRSIDEAPLTVAISRDAWRKQSPKLRRLVDRGVEVLPLPNRRGRRAGLDLRPLMRHLVTEHRATNVMVEGGGRLNGSLIDQGLADELWVFVGGVLGDGSGVRPITTGGRTRRIADLSRWSLAECRRLGDGAVLRYRAGR